MKKQKTIQRKKTSKSGIPGWTKELDPLPIENALKQLIFWKDDLIKAENFSDWLLEHGYKKSSREYLISLDEIRKSKEGLARVQEKIKLAMSLITDTDIAAWKDRKNYPKKK